MILATICEPMNQPGISVERKDNRLVRGEQVVEIAVAQSVRMLGARLQAHQIDDVDDTDFQAWEMLAHDRYRGERLQRGNIAAARHDDIRRAVLVVAGPLPDADALRAVLDGRVHA